MHILQYYHNLLHNDIFKKHLICLSMRVFVKIEIDRIREKINKRIHAYFLIMIIEIFIVSKENEGFFER